MGKLGHIMRQYWRKEDNGEGYGAEMFYSKKPTCTFSAVNHGVYNNLMKKMTNVKYYPKYSFAIFSYFNII